MEKAEEEFRRREIIRDREMRLESAKKCREEEEKDRRWVFFARASYLRDMHSLSLVVVTSVLNGLLLLTC